MTPKIERIIRYGCCPELAVLYRACERYRDRRTEAREVALLEALAACEEALEDFETSMDEYMSEPDTGPSEPSDTRAGLLR
jgi:hypothetical protein